MVKLAEDTIGKDDMNALSDWLRTYPKLTKGKLTEEFEEAYSNWISPDKKVYSVFCNSGSSALLLSIYNEIALGNLKEGDKVLVPSVCWITDISPLIQFGLVPVVVDVNLNDLSYQRESLILACKHHKPKAMILVSVLGIPPNMEDIMAVCKAYNLTLIEDICESLGSTYKGVKLGTHGKYSVSSWYFGHITSAIEGGMITTPDFKAYETLKMLRSHGWNRDLSEETKNELREKYHVDKFNNIYTFYYPSFNLRSTDLQAFIGIRQLEKLDGFVAARNENYNLYIMHFRTNKIDVWLPKNVYHDKEDIISNLGFPIIFKTAKERELVSQKLTEKGVEHRPLISGCITQHPFYQNFEPKIVIGGGNSKYIHECGMYLPNHASLTENDIKEVVGCFS